MVNRPFLKRHLCDGHPAHCPQFLHRYCPNNRFNRRLPLETWCNAGLRWLECGAAGKRLLTALNNTNLQHISIHPYPWSPAVKSVFYLLAVIALPAGIVSAQSKTSSVEKALEISSMTGRPIFVMAGQET